MARAPTSDAVPPTKQLLMVTADSYTERAPPAPLKALPVSWQLRIEAPPYWMLTPPPRTLALPLMVQLVIVAKDSMILIPPPNGPVPLPWITKPSSRASSVSPETNATTGTAEVMVGLLTPRTVMALPL